MIGGIKRWLVGSPLPTAQAVHERLSKTTALAVFSSDALSSVAYGSQEILYQLVLAGAVGIAFGMPVSLAIALLLVIVAASYRQTVWAYPAGGGSYIVAKENLGTVPGLMAASALIIDYILTVAASSAAGINAITSAFPALFPHQTILCVASVLAVSILNLRGVRESGKIFAAPTYLFICAFGLLLIGAGARLLLGRLEPLPPAPELAEASHPLTLWLLLRAFAAGCTALTGIEVISNGVQAFRPPESRNAGITLIWMATILCTFFLCTSFLVTHLGAYPREEETVVSQVARQVFQGGFLYYLVQATTALILLLAVNTSFNGLPRLAAILAKDGFMPRQFANQGDRLVFSNGIFFLAGSSIVLLVIFKGSQHKLLPLYAVGVFLSFTLSQAGMVVHHLKVREAGWRWRMAINGLGTVATGIVLVVIAATKFTHGAWVVVLLIPLFVTIFLRVHAHYREVSRQLSLDRAGPPSPVRHTVIVPVSTLHRGVVQALEYAKALSQDVRAVAINLDPAATKLLAETWAQHGCGVPLIVLDSPYRSIVRPLLGYIDKIDRQHEGDIITVVLPEFVPARWWENLLHNQTALLIKGALLFRRRTVVASVPYQLERAPSGPDRSAP